MGTFGERVGTESVGLKKERLVRVPETGHKDYMEEFPTLRRVLPSGKVVYSRKIDCKLPIYVRDTVNERSSILMPGGSSERSSRRGLHKSGWSCCKD